MEPNLGRLGTFAPLFCGCGTVFRRLSVVPTTAPMIPRAFAPLKRKSLTVHRRHSGGNVNHHFYHVLANRILSRLEFMNQLFELLLAIRTILPRLEARSYLLDVLDVFSNFLLLGLNCVQTSVDA